MPTTQTQPAHRDGLRFKKLDLHLHTPASRCFGDKSVTPDAIVAEAKNKGLSGIAVTDHNSGAWVDLVKAAAERSKLVVFPGVEITCAGGTSGIHLIALFDPQNGKVDIETLLGALGLTPDQFGDTATVVQRSPMDVAKIIHDRGGLAVLAHADSTKGGLEDMRGEQRTILIKSPFISAAEGNDFQSAQKKAAHKRTVDLLDGTDPVYERHLAVYQASDNPTGNGDGNHGLAGIGTRCSFFKLDALNLDGLRQCFVDPEVRIRQDFEFTSFTYPHISRIKVTGGFLDGANAEFHPGLNSILGAKGTGKSLLIEFLRFALNQEPSNPEVYADHDSKLESRLMLYSSVELSLTDETGRSFAVKRTYDPANDSPYEEPDKGNIAQIFPVLFLSQNEIIKIAEDPAQQIKFIDRFFDFRSYQNDIQTINQALIALDRQLAESLRSFEQAKPIERNIATLRQELERLDQSLKNPAFDHFAAIEAKDKELRAQASYLDLLHRSLIDQRTDLEATTPTVPAAELANDPAIKRSHELSKQAHAEVLAAHEAAARTLNEHRKTLQTEYSRWLPQLQTARAQYDAAVQAGGGDYKIIAQKRARTVKELDTAQANLLSLKAKVDRIKPLDASRNEQLTKLKEAYEAYRNERKSKCAKIQDDTVGRLQVGISDSSNRQDFKAKLLLLKKGSYLRDSEIEKICENSDPGSFSRAIIRYGMHCEHKYIAELATKVGIDLSRMATLAEFMVTEFSYETLLGLEYNVLPEDRPDIKYAVGDGTFESLNKLSVGQKCTAMLMIALSEGTTPVVIDQPEDSLDIRSIWEDICSRIRLGKERRQFIFTTHSSSVAVASDSDKFIILEGGATHSQVLFSGSMDHSPVSQKVLDYLEGGDKTYKAKYRKYHTNTRE
jgi:PHP family Zn ribbon phosphoesterase